MNHFQFRYILVTLFLVISGLKSAGQLTIPEELTKSNLKEQMNYLEAHTKIYENFRAIREDMFQKIKLNIIDSLSVSKNEITGLITSTSALKKIIDSLNISNTATEAKLEEITVSKNSIKFFGAEINKSTYNNMMWTIVAVLLVILTLGFLIFQRNMSVTINTNKELKELQSEFETYRRTTREAREKVSMEHFNELKKLRSGDHK
ncbi:MAG TPA: hypothetical protein VIK07_03485 [Bacteroidales bacterium]